MAARNMCLALVVVGFGCSSAKYALLPSANLQSARDPNLTRPLIETPPPRETKAPRSTNNSGPGIDVGLSGAAIAAWLLGGVAPLIGVHGTFDENNPPKPPPPEQ